MRRRRPAGWGGLAGDLGELGGGLLAGLTADPAMLAGIAAATAVAGGLGAVTATALKRNMALAREYGPLGRQFRLQVARGNALPQYWTRLLGGGAAQGYSLNTSEQATQSLLTDAGVLAGRTSAEQRRTMREMFRASRALGIGPQTMATTLGTVSEYGGRHVAPKAFAKLIGQAVTDAQMQGRYGQFLQSLQTTLQTIGTNLAAPTASMAATAVAGISSMSPAMRGPRAAQLAAQMQVGLQAPGLGPAGALVEFRAMHGKGMSLLQTIFQAENPWMVLPGQKESGVARLVRSIAQETGVKPSDFIGPNYVPKAGTAAGSAEIMLGGIAHIGMSKAGMLLAHPGNLAQVAKTLEHPGKLPSAALTEQEKIGANVAKSWLNLSTASQKLLPEVKGVTSAFHSLSSAALGAAGVLRKMFLVPKSGIDISPAMQNAIKQAQHGLGLHFGSGGTSSGTGSEPVSHADFVKRMKPMAQKVSAATGFPTNFLLAQWGEESDWGTSPAAKNRLNFGGLGITGSNVAGPKFTSLQQFERADILALEQQRYAGARLYAQQHPKDVAGIAKLLQAEGYATDVHYGQNVAASAAMLPSADTAQASVAPWVAQQHAIAQRQQRTQRTQQPMHPADADFLQQQFGMLGRAVEEAVRGLFPALATAGAIGGAASPGGTVAGQ